MSADGGSRLAKRRKSVTYNVPYLDKNAHQDASLPHLVGTQIPIRPSQQLISTHLTAVVFRLPPMSLLPAQPGKLGRGPVIPTNIRTGLLSYDRLYDMWQAAKAPQAPVKMRLYFVGFVAASHNPSFFPTSCVMHRNLPAALTFPN